jgi:hypothetical protein
VGLTAGGGDHRLCPRAPGPACGLAIHALHPEQRTAAPRRHRAGIGAARPNINSVPEVSGRHGVGRSP